MTCTPYFTTFKLLLLDLECLAVQSPLSFIPQDALVEFSKRRHLGNDKTNLNFSSRLTHIPKPKSQVSMRKNAFSLLNNHKFLFDTYFCGGRVIMLFCNTNPTVGYDAQIAQLFSTIFFLIIIYL